MTYRDEIIHSDCLAGMSALPDSSADIAIIDPPYNIGKDFGGVRDRMLIGEYAEWCGEWVGEALRTLKPSGTMFIYGFPETLAHISVSLPLKKQRWLVWHYANKNMPHLNFWQRSHESILCVWKDSPIFNRDDIREPYSEGFLKGCAGKTRPAGDCRMGKRGVDTIYNAHEKGALPRDVIHIPALAGGAGAKERAIYCKTCASLVDPAKRKEHANHELVIHPTQKPLLLSEKLIMSCRPKGNFNVLVPFCGSGTECLAAKRLGGNFAAYELNGDYITLAKAVIAAGKLQPSGGFRD